MRMPIGGGYAFFKSSKGMKANPYLERALEKLVSSGRLNIELEKFSADMSEEVFKNISVGLKNIKVK